MSHYSGFYQSKSDILSVLSYEKNTTIAKLIFFKTKTLSKVHMAGALYH